MTPDKLAKVREAKETLENFVNLTSQLLDDITWNRDLKDIRRLAAMQLVPVRSTLAALDVESEKRHKPKAISQRLGPQKRLKAHTNSDWIKSRIKMKHTSQRRLAKALGIHFSTMSLLVSGRRRIRLKEAAALARQFETSIEEVLKNFGVKESDVKIYLREDAEERERG